MCPAERTVELSLVIPLHDEADNVESLLTRCLAALESVTPDFEILLVDDGSRDGTCDRIRAAAEAEPRVHATSLRRRFGKGAALSAGVARARGRRIATIDADLQEDPAEIGKLLALLDQGLDLVTGWRRNRRDGALKNWSSRVFNGLTRLLTGVRLHDINCGFKVMTREVAGDLFLSAGRFRFMPVLAHWWGYRVGEQEVTHRPRVHGRSHYGSERFPGAVVDLLTLMCLMRFHSRPGHLFVTVGMMSGFVGGAICAHLAWIFIQEGTIDWRYPRLSLGVLLIVIGVQLVATGFLGEWLAYRDRGGEPDYRVKWESPREKRVEPECDD